MKVLTFGELLIRLSAPGFTRLFQKDTFDVSFCGAEANVAVSLANYNIPVSFLTKLPNNEIGVAAKHSLDYFTVDTQDIVFGEGRMGAYYLEKGASQRSSKVIYDRKYSAIAIAKRQDFNWDKIFNDVTWFHFSGITPALSDELSIICEEACKVAKAKNITISCDLNYRKQLWTPDQAKKVMSNLMKYVDVCIGNEEDAEKVLGIKCSSKVEKGLINENDYIEIAEEIHRIFGCKWVAFTLRESINASTNGWSAILYEENKAYFSKKYTIQLIDRVGGGDSFSAALIYGLILKKVPQEVIELATAASCLKQTIEGDYNRVTIDEIYALINNGGHGRVQR